MEDKKEKHLFVEDDILAEKSLKGEFNDKEEPKILKDLKVSSENPMFNMGADEQRKILRQEAIKHIKHLRQETRDIYYLNIDEKSVIPWIKNFFGISDEELK